MTHLEKLTTSFDAIGVEYTVRERGEYSYVFVGECRCIHNLDLNFKTGPLDTLTAISKFYEFEDGELVTYSNS
jgi:hypothetical protein